MRSIIRNLTMIALGAALSAVFMPAAVADWIADKKADAAEAFSLGQTLEDGTTDTESAISRPSPVSVDSVKLRNTTFELVPVRGGIDTRTGGGRARVDAPWWAGPEDANGYREYAHGYAEIEVTVRNLGASTLTGAYWHVDAYNMVDGKWYEAYTPNVNIPITGPGDSSRGFVGARIHPETTAVRFTVTYQEPGGSPAAATLEYPW